MLKKYHSENFICNAHPVVRRTKLVRTICNKRKCEDCVLMGSGNGEIDWMIELIDDLESIKPV